jgi:Domain of unknown function (DUF6471)
MKTEREWTEQAKGLLKAELKRRNISYQRLASLLKDAGISDTPENIANKLSRGKFTAVFMIQCLEVIGCRDLRLGE